jgi:hypothetical protein
MQYKTLYKPPNLHKKTGFSKEGMYESMQLIGKLDLKFGD